MSSEIVNSQPRIYGRRAARMIKRMKWQALQTASAPATAHGPFSLPLLFDTGNTKKWSPDLLQCPLWTNTWENDASNSGTKPTVLTNSKNQCFRDGFTIDILTSACPLIVSCHVIFNGQFCPIARTCPRCCCIRHPFNMHFGTGINQAMDDIPRIISIFQGSKFQTLGRICWKEWRHDKSSAFRNLPSIHSWIYKS